MKCNKMIPFNGYANVSHHLDELHSKNDVVVLFSSREEVCEFKSRCDGAANLISLSEKGFCSESGVVYLSTPTDFLSHYMLSLLRKAPPKFSSDITFVAVDIDSYLVTDGLTGLVIPIEGLVKKEHNDATIKLVSVTLGLLASEAQKENPFYSDYTFSKNNGFHYGASFYENCVLAWGELNPSNKDFKDNPGYHQFLSIVMYFVEALHTCHPDAQYTIEGGRVDWVDGNKTYPYPLQQIIEARHGLGISPIDPVTVRISMDALLTNAKSLLFFSSTPELFNAQMLKMYNIESKLEYNSPVLGDKSFKYFVSESIMINTLVSRACSAQSHDCQFVVYTGSRDFHYDDFAGTSVVFLNRFSTYDDYEKVNKEQDAVVVYWDTPLTDIEEASVLRKVSLITNVVSIEHHLDPNNESLNAISPEKRDGLLFASQAGGNFLVRRYAKNKLSSASRLFQYDNRGKAADIWQSNTLIINTLFEHYEGIRQDISSLYNMAIEDVSELFDGVDIDSSNIGEALQLLHFKALSRFSVSSSYRGAISIMSPKNITLGKNVWDPSDVIKGSLA